MMMLLSMTMMMESKKQEKECRKGRKKESRNDYLSGDQFVYKIAPGYMPSIPYVTFPPSVGNNKINLIRMSVIIILKRGK